MIRAFPIRASLLWLALHAFVAAVNGSEALQFSVPMSIVLIVSASLLGFLDTRRRHEFTLLGNLGIPGYMPSVVWGATALVLEVLLRIGRYLCSDEHAPSGLHRKEFWTEPNSFLCAAHRIGW